MVENWSRGGRRTVTIFYSEVLFPGIHVCSSRTSRLLSNSLIILFKKHFKRLPIGRKAFSCDDLFLTFKEKALSLGWSPLLFPMKSAFYFGASDSLSLDFASLFLLNAINILIGRDNLMINPIFELLSSSAIQNTSNMVVIFSSSRVNRG